MRLNGVPASITHDPDLGFHVMPLDEKSQLLIKENGQPTHAKAIPLEGEFTPLSKAESLPAVQPFYSSLERLIEKQRPTDIRNGKQWIKYLTTQGMSLAEIKHTGVWEELLVNETKKGGKRKLVICDK